MLRRRPALGMSEDETLDVGHGDLLNNGLQDVYLACDFGTDDLFLNNGDGTFREVTSTATGWEYKERYERRCRGLQ